MAEILKGVEDQDAFVTLSLLGMSEATVFKSYNMTAYS